MGRMFVHINTSVDGYINDAQGGINWWAADEEFNDYIDAMLASIDGMVFGRVAHEELAHFWPGATSESATETQARLMRDLPKYVLSSRDTIADWHQSHLLRPSPSTALRELKAVSPGDLAVFAGAAAVTSALAAGVVDEVRLVVHPALVGDGTKLFAGTHPFTGLDLTEVQKFRSGALALRYTLT